MFSLLMKEIPPSSQWELSLAGKHTISATENYYFPASLSTGRLKGYKLSEGLFPHLVIGGGGLNEVKNETKNIFKKNREVCFCNTVQIWTAALQGNLRLLLNKNSDTALVGGNGTILSSTQEEAPVWHIKLYYSPMGKGSQLSRTNCDCSTEDHFIIAWRAFEALPMKLSSK